MLSFVLTFLARFSAATMGANSITGVVRNKNRGEPAAGEGAWDVVVGC